MQVIHVGKGKKRVQGRVNGSGDAVFAEGCQWVIANHLVFVRFPAIELFKLFEALQMEQRKPGFLDRSQIAAAAFDCQDANQFAAERVGQVYF